MEYPDVEVCEMCLDTGETCDASGRTIKCLCKKIEEDDSEGEKRMEEERGN
jgi:hypothetical protein